jgi:uncharacterized protein YecE (DUF72 family)
VKTEKAANLRVGTSAFTAAGWEGTFYPSGMQPRDFLSYYATQFNTVEVDSTFYRTPRASTVEGWAKKTPEDFIFSLKVPQIITHEKVLQDCQAEFEQFVSVACLLGKEKLGPLLLQFPYFNKTKFNSGREFLARLAPFLKKLPKDYQFVVEIRNKQWLSTEFFDLLREHRVAFALIDQAWMPRPRELFDKFDPITAPLTYVRWLGDRKGIEERTKTWDKTIVDRRREIAEWVKILKQIMPRDLKAFAYANNHYAGNGPATVKLFWDTWNQNS